MDTIAKMLEDLLFYKQHNSDKVEQKKSENQYRVYTSGAGCHHHFSAQLKSHDSRFISAMDATANGLDILIFIVSLHC